MHASMYVCVYICMYVCVCVHKRNQWVIMYLLEYAGPITGFRGLYSVC